MLKIQFGNYSGRGSFIHKLDPRLKLLYVITLSVNVFLVKSLWSIFVFSFFIFIIVKAAKIKNLEILKWLKPFYLIFAFIFLMYLLFSRNRILYGMLALWRFLILILISFVLTSTASTSDIVLAMEKLLKPLKILNIKPRNVAVMVSMAIRFLPVLLASMERVVESMVSRLADLRKLKNIKLLILALLEKLFRAASNLSDAMQSRLYNENIDNPRILKLKEVDYGSMLIIILIFAISLY